ncbi:hypothetical protein FOL47_009056 [Perkinsus chesapeaki]|uniref:Uncharacterized protein n=1 Tax=Perkinsus chesapeaki TaxID=330153 RepID=A0A7J6MTI0_PERCH|nr:hypothetical protein FOL47_009056 [Perkinsus chesapeaki]
MTSSGIRLRLSQAFRPAKPWCALAPRFETLVKESGLQHKNEAMRKIVSDGYFTSEECTVGLAATSGTVYVGLAIPEADITPLESLIANLMNHGEIGLAEYCYGIGNCDTILKGNERALLKALGRRPARILLGEVPDSKNDDSVPPPKGHARLLKHYIGKGAEVFDVICKSLMDHAYVASQLAYNGGGGCALRLESGDIVRAPGIVVEGEPIISAAQAALVGLRANGLVDPGAGINASKVIEAAICSGDNEQAGVAAVELVRSLWPSITLRVESEVNCTPLQPQPRA